MKTYKLNSDDFNYIKRSVEFSNLKSHELATTYQGDARERILTVLKDIDDLFYGPNEEVEIILVVSSRKRGNY
jgi:hypothetical protein